MMSAGLIAPSKIKEGVKLCSETEEYSRPSSNANDRNLKFQLSSLFLPYFNRLIHDFPVVSSRGNETKVLAKTIP